MKNGEAMKTTRTVVHGPGGSTTVTERTSYSSGGGGDFGDFGDFGGSHFSDGFGSSGHRFHTDIGGGGFGGRRAKSGWGTRHGGSEPKRPSGPPMKLEGKTYDEIKAQCLRENRLFEDPDFPANDSSVFPSKRPPRPFEWKRPSVSNIDSLCYTTRRVQTKCLTIQKLTRKQQPNQELHLGEGCYGIRFLV